MDFEVLFFNRSIGESSKSASDSEEKVETQEVVVTAEINSAVSAADSAEGGKGEEEERKEKKEEKVERKGDSSEDGVETTPSVQQNSVIEQEALSATPQTPADSRNTLED